MVVTKHNFGLGQLVVLSYSLCGMAPPQTIPWLRSVSASDTSPGMALSDV